MRLTAFIIQYKIFVVQIMLPTFTQACTHEHICTQAHMCVHMPSHIHTHVYAHVHRYTHTCIHYLHSTWQMLWIIMKTFIRHYTGDAMIVMKIIVLRKTFKGDLGQRHRLAWKSRKCANIFICRLLLVLLSIFMQQKYFSFQLELLKVQSCWFLLTNEEQGGKKKSWLMK